MFILDPQLNPSSGGCPTPPVGVPHAVVERNGCEFWRTVLNKGGYETRHAIEMVVLVGATEPRLQALHAHINDPGHLDHYLKRAEIDPPEEMMWAALRGPDGDSYLKRQRPAPSITAAGGAVYEAAKLVSHRLKGSSRAMSVGTAAKLIWREFGLPEDAALSAARWSSNPAKAYQRELAAKLKGSAVETAIAKAIADHFRVVISGEAT